MIIHERKEADICILEPEGRIDTDTLDLFSEYMHNTISQDIRAVIINFSKTEYLNSGGLHVLLDARKQLAASSKAFVICQPNEKLLELFTIVKIHLAFQLYECEEDAIQSVKNLN